jgi:hypothetical protein
VLYASNDLIVECVRRFRKDGIHEALESKAALRTPSDGNWVPAVEKWLKGTPQDFGYFRQRWTCSMLAEVLAKKVSDGWVEGLAKTVYADKQETAAEAVAAALADGVDPDAVSEAISLAGTMLVLGDPGRKKEWSSPNKPEGSVHGDSIGVHASDAANGWRHIAKVASARNTFAAFCGGEIL